MPTFETVDLRVCRDCACICANGEAGTDDDDAHADRMVATLGDNWRHMIVDCEDDFDVTGDDYSRCHDDFSTARCDACGTDLAGDRCHAVLLIPTATEETAR